MLLLCRGSLVQLGEGQPLDETVAVFE